MLSNRSVDESFDKIETVQFLVAFYVYLVTDEVFQPSIPKDGFCKDNRICWVCLD